MKVEVFDLVFSPQNQSVTLSVAFTVPIDSQRRDVMEPDLVKKKVFDRFAKDAEKEVESRKQDQERSQRIEAYCASIFKNFSDKIKPIIEQFNGQLGEPGAVSVTQEGEDTESPSLKQKSITIERQRYPKSKFRISVCPSLQTVCYYWRINGRSSPAETTLKICEHAYAAFHLEIESQSQADKNHVQPHEIIEDVLTEFLYQLLSAIKQPR
jgi:hypothetical protein